MPRFTEVASWTEAERRSLGYENDLVINHYATKVDLIPNLNSPIFSERINILKKYMKSLKLKENLSVWDVGGGNGYLSKFVDFGIKSWTVIESEQMAKVYQKKYAGGLINFVSKLPINEKPDLVIISCVLQYLPKPDELFLKILELTDSIVLLRHCESGTPNDFFAVQHIDEGKESLSWPIRFFRKNWLIEKLDNKFTIVQSDEMLETNEYRNEKIKLKAFAISRTIVSPDASPSIHH